LDLFWKKSLYCIRENPEATSNASLFAIFPVKFVQTDKDNLEVLLHFPTNFKFSNIKKNTFKINRLDSQKFADIISHQ
jgi:hypothetical protein